MPPHRLSNGNEKARSEDDYLFVQKWENWKRILTSRGGFTMMFLFRNLCCNLPESVPVWQRAETDHSNLASSNIIKASIIIISKIIDITIVTLYIENSSKLKNYWNFTVVESSFYLSMLCAPKLLNHFHQPVSGTHQAGPFGRSILESSTCKACAEVSGLQPSYCRCNPVCHPGWV